MNLYGRNRPAVQKTPGRKRVWKLLVFVFIGYVLYILALGPLVALDGNGYLTFVPERVFQVLSLPMQPLIGIPGLSRVLRDYFDCWYHDPNDPYSSPDWI